MKLSLLYAAVSLAAVVCVHCRKHGRPVDVVPQLPSRPEQPLWSNYKLNNLVSSEEHQTSELITDHHESKHYIEAKCPEGFFRTGSSYQCFRLYTNRMSWDGAVAMCKAEKLKMAQPEDPVSVTAYLVETYGLTTYSWVGARGDGTSVKWQSGDVLSEISPYWYPWLRMTAVNNDNNCVFMLTTKYFEKYYTGTPYYSYNCQYSLYTLCELPAVCPEGFFSTGRSTKCFKLFQDVERNWPEAKANCEANQLILAQPQDPVAVNAYLVETYGTKRWTWIGARGNGHSMVWQHSGEKLSCSSPYWMWRPTIAKISTSFCLELMSRYSWQAYHCDTPYNVNLCSKRFWSLCELAPCPEGFFRAGNSSQCFHFFNNIRCNWKDAKKYCEDRNLALAAPQDPVAARTYIVENYGADNSTWLDARGDGTQLKWERSGELINNDDPLWIKTAFFTAPGPRVTPSFNLVLLTLTRDMGIEIDPNRPYGSVHGSDLRYTLCEVV